MFKFLKKTVLFLEQKVGVIFFSFACDESI